MLYSANVSCPAACLQDATAEAQQSSADLSPGTCTDETAAKPADLDQYCVRRHARVGGLINKYRLVA